MFTVFLPFFFSFFCSWVGRGFAFALALMSFILATLQSCPVAVSNQIPFDVFVYDEEQPGLFVMYRNVAPRGGFIKPVWLRMIVWLTCELGTLQSFPAGRRSL